MLIDKIGKIFKCKGAHFIYSDVSFYNKWKYIIRVIMFFNPYYVSCEIFRKKYKSHRNIVVYGLKWNGKNARRRTTGYAKDYVRSHKRPYCIYCNTKLIDDNATADHIVPVSRGGNNAQLNLIVCCFDCNNQRGDMDFYKYLAIKTVKYKGVKQVFV